MYNKAVTREIIVDGEEEEEVLADTRHKEMRKWFSRLIDAVQKNSEDTAFEKIEEGILKQTISLNQIVKEIKDISINVEINPQDFISSINKMCSDMVAEIKTSNNEVISAVSNRLLPDTFTLVKDSRGTTESVKVNYKQDSKIKNNN